MFKSLRGLTSFRSFVSVAVINVMIRDGRRREITIFFRFFFPSFFSYKGILMVLVCLSNDYNPYHGFLVHL